MVEQRKSNQHILSALIFFGGFFFFGFYSVVLAIKVISLLFGENKNGLAELIVSKIIIIVFVFMCVVIWAIVFFTLKKFFESKSSE